MRLMSFLQLQDPISIGLAVLALSVTLGLSLGAIRFRGMRLGISGVLFSALLFGQIGLTVDPHILQFLRDFALIIFIYALGLQVGPAFVTSLRAEGLRLNGLSVAVLVLGAMMTGATVRLSQHFPHLLRTMPQESAPGLYAGAFTTTPGLAAGQEALRHKGKSTEEDDKAMATASLAYSVTYPFGVVGPILVIVFLRRLFRVNLADERRELLAAEEVRRPPIESADVEVTLAEYVGTALRDHPVLRKYGIVLSRLLRDQTMMVPTADTLVQMGDVYRAVGPRTGLSEFVSAMGHPAKADLRLANGDVQRMDMVVTRTQVLRRTLQDLDLTRRHGVTIARITRAGVDLAPRATQRLAFADNIIAVGPEAGLKQVADELGNCPDILNRPQLVPIFLGIVMGVLVGSIPFTIPGLHTTLRIGLAGGPLLAAIALSQLGNLGSVVWYMPPATNSMFRDFGLAVFLACVGLESGDHLWQRVTSPEGAGLSFVLWGAMVTILPCLIVGIIARIVYKMNFFTLAGWVSGAMTSTTGLAFANELAESDAPAVAYAAIAPLATLVPIICAQLLAMGTL
jgi:putative transport protein